MAEWGPLRSLLAGVVDRRTFDWSELDSLVGGLPRSAYDHAAFWSGARSGWPGFRTTDVRVGRSVTFVRHGSAPGPRRAPTPIRAARDRRPDVVLVGCVKTKLGSSAPAKDLYVSPLFRKARAYAEAAAPRWFILSAEHGLLEPETVIEPYDRRLSDTSADYRRTWGRQVLQSLRETLGSLDGLAIEVHAGSSYVDAIRDGLVRGGADVTEPLVGLGMGSRLAWYDVARPLTGVEVSAVEAPDVQTLVERLLNLADARTPAAVLATRGEGLGEAGLYSWWVDSEGAADLTTGLGHIVRPGMIYVGLAGATRAASGRPSTNTLWGRLHSMHLKGTHEFSTFRRSLGAVLAESLGWDGIDEAQLSDWMSAHLRVVTVLVRDRNRLEALESGVLQRLDPPLNISKVPRNDLRQELSALRRKHV